MQQLENDVLFLLAYLIFVFEFYKQWYQQLVLLLDGFWDLGVIEAKKDGHKQKRGNNIADIYIRLQ